MPTSLATAPADLRPAFGRAASSVWIITTATAGQPVGFTAISLVSVSVDPALVSFNLSKSSSSAPALLGAKAFAAHLLAGDQEALARRFAGPAAHRFGPDTPWGWDADGLPALEGAVARLSGTVRSFVDAGDSHLVVGAVLGAVTAERVPLVHWNRTYTPATPATPAGGGS